MPDSRPFYGLSAPIRPGTALLLGIQHVLAMFVGIITPPLILVGALGLSAADSAFLISMALLTSGLTTLIQVARLGPVGSGLLSVQGTSFTFVPLAIEAGGLGGLGLVFGMSFVAAPFEILLGQSVRLARKLFPPLVTGCVVLLIGMSLTRFALADLAGGLGDPSFGALSSFGLGLFVLAVILIFRWFVTGPLSTVSIAVGIVVGYVVGALLGWVDFTPFFEAPWITVPQPLKYGMDFKWALLVPWLIGYFVTTMETIGDLSATSAVSREPVRGPRFQSRLRRGLRADGIGSLLAALFNAMPNTTFSQNNPVIALTGVATRRVGFYVAALLVCLGLTPKLAALVAIMPKPVLGGATVLLFGMIAASGLKIAAKDGLGIRNQFVLAVSLALGLGVTLGADVVQALQVPESIRLIAASGMAVGGLTALFLNLILPQENEPADEAR